VKYTPLRVRNLLHFFFWFFRSPTGESVRPIFTLNTSNDAILYQKVHFYCCKIKILFFTYLFKKFEKITIELRGKFKNYFNCHNFGCVQDIVVIFDSRIWHSETA